MTRHGPGIVAVAARVKRSILAFEELNDALVLLGRLVCRESSQIWAATRLRIVFA